jgi:putative endonuclease
MYYIYIIKNSAGDLYVGLSENPKQRLADHNNKQGANFTKNLSDYRIVFLEEYPTLSSARKREIQIKKWRRDKKELLVKRFNDGLRTKPQSC